MAGNGVVEKIKEKALEVKKPLTIQALVEQSARELGKALPSHMRPERIVRIALTTLRMNPKLYQCNPQSFLAALFQCAQLGLEPTILGEAWIIPYNSKDGPVAQFQVGYQGFVKLFWNHQNSVSIQAEVVRRNDQFESDLGENKIHHVPPAFDRERGEVIGYYAVAHLSNGGRQVKVMSKTEILVHAKKFTKCYDAQKGEFMKGTPWSEHFDEMAKKTVLKQLLKLLPKSTEIQHALAMDETVKTRVEANMVEVPNEAEYTTEATAEINGQETRAIAAPEAAPAELTKENLFPNK